jgi:hypothetical protein
MEPVVIKRCIKCGCEKTPDLFPTSRKSNICKDCHREYYRDYKENNKDTIKENQQRYCENNPDKIRESKSKCYISHYAEYNKNNRDWALNHPEEINAHRVTYRKTPAGKLSISRANHKRRSRESETNCDLTLDQWDKILHYQGNKCAMCYVWEEVLQIKTSYERPHYPRK